MSGRARDFVLDRERIRRTDGHRAGLGSFVSLAMSGATAHAQVAARNAEVAALAAELGVAIMPLYNLTSDAHVAHVVRTRAVARLMRCSSCLCPGCG